VTRVISTVVSCSLTNYRQKSIPAIATKLKNTAGMHRIWFFKWSSTAAY